MTLSKKGDAEPCVGETLIKKCIWEIFVAMIDKNLNFDDPVNFICMKASGKLTALTSVTPYISVEK